MGSTTATAVRAGRIAEIPGGLDLLYPQTEVGLTFTLIHSDGTRHGGHAVLATAGDQLTLQQILDGLAAEAGTATGLYVLGGIALWNRNWNLPQTRDLIVNALPVGSVGQIGGALGLAPDQVVQFDTTGWTADDLDVHFGYRYDRRALCALDRQGTEFTVPHHPEW
ncbi:hypothetical protein [Nocardia thailandica]|uniref:hypothetical protein n=1 Tax=Nocardia thailandica TaxID=257275 RepID=UPI0003035422|nr:hypothetical protein [Nocardia thailandica]